jgi:hypothetical protein
MSTEGPVERHNVRPVVDRKTRMVGIITRWVVFVSCLMPWGIILAWLASRFAAQ